MKKIFRLFAAIAASTLAFSCMEEAAPEAGIQNGGSQYDGPMTTITFSLDNLETKTAWDGENFTWSEGDKIKIIYGTEDNAYTVAEVVDGTVTATVGDVDTYYAVYPSDNKYLLSIPEGAEEAVLNVTIPQTQNGSFKQANVMAAKTTKEDLNFVFKNLTHIFRFTVSDDCEYTRFQFCSNQDVRINGTYDVAFGDDVTLTYNGNGEQTNSRYLYFNLPEGQKGPFYLGFEPGAKMEYGFGVSARRNAAEGYVAGAVTIAPVVTNRSVITNLGSDFDKHIINNWYIKENGTGDGSSWEYAANVSLLIKLMNKTQLTADKTHTGTTHEWRLADAHIHVAAGTYDIQAANGNANYTPNGLTANTKVTIIGGYPENPSDDAVPGEGETIFTTGNTIANSRIFDFNAVKTGNLTFKGISFKKEDANAVGLLNFRYSVSGNVTFEDCVISVQTTNTNGGAVRITPTTKDDLSIKFERCTFADNNGSFKNGGAIYMTDAAACFNECVFSNNTSSTTGAGINATGSTVDLNACTFSNNVATADGGGIYATGSTVDLNGCTFSNNVAKTNGGGIYATGSTVDLNACTFSNNVATADGGGIYATGSTVDLNGCTFSNNVAKTNGGGIYATGSTINVHNSKFIGNKGNGCADIYYATGTCLFVNRSVFREGETEVNSSAQWWGTAISNGNYSGKSVDTSSEDRLGINNSVFYNYSNNGTSRVQPVILTQQRYTVINSSIYSNCTQTVRFAHSNTDDVNVNNVILNKKEGGVSLVQSAVNTSSYNVMLFPTTGGYQSPQTGDTSLESSSNFNMTWSDSNNNFTWELLNGITLGGNTKVSNVEQTVMDHHAAFDTWLKTVEEDPYGIDFNGNKRNAEKMNPGAWDPGL